MVNSVFNWKSAIQGILSLTLMGWVTPVWSNPSGIHILIDFTGDVQVKKEEWMQFHQANSGITLSSQDQIKLGSKASITILCSSLNQSKVTEQGTHLISQGCLTGEPTIKLCSKCNNDENNMVLSR